MKSFSISVMLFFVLLSINAFGNTITNYLEINNMNQFHNWLSENKYDEFMEIYKSEFVPFTLIDEGRQVVFQKGMYIEGRDLKSTYIKKDSLTDFINKENLKFLSNKKNKLEKDGFIVAIYDIDDIITNQYLINKNIEKSLVDHLQLITIERNDNILWYTINETKTPSEELVKSNIELINTFKILDFVVLDKDSVIFSYYKIGRNHWMRVAYLDIINFKDKSLVERYAFPMDLDSSNIYTGEITNTKILSDSLVKMNFTYKIRDKKEYKGNVIWLYKYPIDKIKLLKDKGLGFMSFNTDPKVLWISDKENNMSFYKIVNIDDFYYDNILGDAEPTIDELREKFPEDRFL